MRAMMSDCRLSDVERMYQRAAGHQGAAAETICDREARWILGATEPAGRRSGSDYDGVVHSWPAARHYYLGSAGMAPYAATLAESLAAACADGGLLDQMAAVQS